MEMFTMSLILSSCYFRYKNLNQSERKRLEYDEDKLLSIMIYNLIAFMVMVNVPKESVMKIVRTLVGKSRVTNCYATEITSLMAQLSNLVRYYLWLT
jgi:hypothetical protein